MVNITSHYQLREMNRQLALKYGAPAVAAAIDKALSAYKLECIGEARVQILDGIYHHTVGRLERP